ncbi:MULTISPECIES: hypothetical protein [unclassified Crossiella]|uniref:hypothetical protein n=1 Tax=unclassified Crossiella TaxID=2620835 RepID=UPI001FFF272F|nr:MULTISPECIES: hypothetical protein [unclassified Crossiella]MCK2245428.1 hypothetical protein [Crossiella sp. S99.2]MCK2259080.1 hypothetical protein [Crossiella sp. S99.1]
MQDTTHIEADLAIAPAESVARQDFEWSAQVGTNTVAIVRTAHASPVWIQANN